MEEPQPLYADHLILSPCNSGKRRSSYSNSPEFEFWMTRNPSFPQPNLLAADELFSGGVLLPLHLLHLHAQPPQDTEPSKSEPELRNSIDDFSASSMLTSSKRWRDIFKKSSQPSNSVNADHNSKEKNISNNKEKKIEKKNGSAGGGVGASNRMSAAELNINIWPFSRSRSTGTGGTRPRMPAATRKVSSAPCSRSNSAGESKSRKWPSSPSRARVHLGKNSPVWPARRSGGWRSSGTVVKIAEKGVKKDGNEDLRKIKTAVSSGGGGGAKGKVLNFNVPMCIDYRHHLSCRSEENSVISVATAASSGRGRGGGGSQNGGGVSSEGVRGGNLFNIRSLFTKKVY